MLKQRNLILLAIFALWLIIYLFNTRHSSCKYNTNNEIKGFDVDSRENKASMKDQLRFDSFTYGHQATDYPKWIQATAPYKVKYKAYYEPYMILPKDVPKYEFII
ncbi:hypothetical protein KUTeg_012106, partial [Tegillarca granosa]